MSVDVNGDVIKEAAQSGSGKKFLIIGGVSVLLLALLSFGLYSMLSGKTSSKQKKQPKITMLTPPPPPPRPPPPKFEKKPDPPKEQKEMKVDQQVVKKEVEQQSPELKMDGPAGDGPSAFSAGKITSEDLSKLGTGKATAEKAGMFSPFNNYASLIKGELQRYLSKNNTLRRSRYIVEVHVWVDGNGGIKRFELVGTTKDADMDEAIRAAISALPSFSQAPPASMPSPIRLKITTSN